jgi:hypothetical protein
MRRGFTGSPRRERFPFQGSEARGMRSAASPGVPNWRTVSLGLGQDQAAVEREGIELDGEAIALLVGTGRANARPDGFLADAAILDGVGDKGWVLAHDRFRFCWRPHHCVPRALPTAHDLNRQTAS